MITITDWSGDKINVGPYNEGGTPSVIVEIVSLIPYKGGIPRTLEVSLNVEQAYELLDGIKEALEALGNEVM